MERNRKDRDEVITPYRKSAIAAFAALLIASGCSGSVVELDADALAISADHRHGCALLSERTIGCWGENQFTQLGDGTLENSPDGLRPVVGIQDAVQLTTGEDFSCAIVAGGEVRCWGFNLAGQVGDGATYAISDARTPVPGVADAIWVAAGRSHACAALNDGTARCWGANGSGQLGDGSRTDRLLPVAVRGIDDTIALSAGADFTCALLADGTVSCWGLNALGQLGNGSRIDRAEPVRVRGLDGVVALDSQLAMTCAVRVDGSVWCWGTPGGGDAGNAVPVRIAGVGGASDVAVGEQTSCALTNGSTRCWTGTSSAWTESSKTADAVDLALLGRSLCTLDGDGKIVCSTIR